MMMWKIESVVAMVNILHFLSELWQSPFLHNMQTLPLTKQIWLYKNEGLCRYCRGGYLGNWWFNIVHVIVWNSPDAITISWGLIAHDMSQSTFHWEVNQSSSSTTFYWSVWNSNIYHHEQACGWRRFGLINKMVMENCGETWSTLSPSGRTSRASTSTPSGCSLDAKAS